MLFSKNISENPFKIETNTYLLKLEIFFCKKLSVKITHLKKT